MASGYVVSGRGDLDVLFRARFSGLGAVTNYVIAGYGDIYARYEPRGATTPVADTGFTVGGTDLAQLFQGITVSPNTISISNLTAASIVVGTATAQYILNNSGDILSTLTNNATSDRGDWIAPKSNFSSYSARVTTLTGALTSGAVNTWLNLGTTRAWQLQTGGVADCTFLVEIRTDADGIVRDTATITMHAENGA